MQEITYDGDETLTPYITDKQFKAALDNPKNATVALHKPGAEFKSGGLLMRVNQDGSLSVNQRKRRRKNIR